MKSLTLFICIAAFLIAGSATAIEDRTVKVKTEDAEMLDAMQKAQDSLDDFLAVKANPPPGATAFKLKVKIVDGHRVEYMWVTPFKQTATGFTGILADTPEYVTTVTMGQKLTFPRSDIADWGYAQDGKQKGSFTVCVLFKHMPPAEVRMYRDKYGFEC